MVLPGGEDWAQTSCDEAQGVGDKVKAPDGIDRTGPVWPWNSATG